jgi:hypothetical protein
MDRTWRHADPFRRTEAGCRAGRRSSWLPVLLRKGERELGGALSWIEPQPLADYPPNSPFAGLPTPRDVTVTARFWPNPPRNSQHAPGQVLPMEPHWSQRPSAVPAGSCCFM